MNDLVAYVRSHVERGDCQCGKCFDLPENPQQPTWHTADVAFFKVKIVGEPKAEELKSLIAAHSGVFANVDLLDGKEHNYQEIGGWIGDQGLALMLMGLGELVGLWKLLTPRSLLGNDLPDDLVKQMAGAGFVAIQGGSNTA